MSILGLPVILLCGRRESAATNRLRAVGIEPICLFPPRDAESPVRGCFAAHRQGLEYAQHNGLLPCIIVEDNVKVTLGFDAARTRDTIARALALQPSVVLLARFPFSRGVLHRYAQRNLLEVGRGSVTGCTAYVATTRTVALCPAWRGTPIDNEMASWPDRLAMVPMPFCRSSTSTTNKWVWAQRWRVPSLVANAWLMILPWFAQYAQYLDNLPSLVIGLLMIVALLLYLLHWRKS